MKISDVYVIINTKELNDESKFLSSNRSEKYTFDLGNAEAFNIKPKTTENESAVTIAQLLSYSSQVSYQNGYKDAGGDI